MRADSSSAPMPHNRLERMKVAAKLLVFLIAISCDATPGEPIITGISLSPASVSLLVGEVRQITAKVTDASGALVPDAKIVFTSSDSSVVAVDSSGIAVARTAGSTFIGATSGGVSAQAEIAVRKNAIGWTKTARQCGIFDGEIYCWDLALLSGTIARPKHLSIPAKLVDINAGTQHYCAIDTARSLWCWGSNAFGQLGTGRMADEPTPVPVMPGTPVASVAAGPYHTCVITHSAELFCWGANTTGQLGRATNERCGVLQISCSRQPVKLSLPESMVAATAGGKLSTGDQTAGTGHTCGLTGSGVAHCWGAGFFGQLGQGSQLNSEAPAKVFGVSRYVAIAAGEYHSCAVTNSGAVECWGLNSDGQIGRDPLPSDPTFSCRSGDVVWECATRPVEISSVKRFRDIAAGYLTSCGLTLYSDIFCWGEGRFGQLGDGIFYTAAPYGSFVPVQVRSHDKFIALDNQGALTCGVTPDGKAYCWGNGVALPRLMPNP